MQTGSAYLLLGDGMRVPLRAVFLEQLQVVQGPRCRRDGCEGPLDRLGAGIGGAAAGTFASARAADASRLDIFHIIQAWV